MNIHFGDYGYEFLLENDLEGLGVWCARKGLGNFLIISDDGVPAKITSDVAIALHQYGTVLTLNFPYGEKYKNLNTVHQLVEDAVSKGVDRSFSIVAVGGGLTGNVAGMVAAMLYRGLALIHVPTTFLAASDSTLSLKQAVNLNNGKNLVGYFYCPHLVYVNLPFMQGLPARQVLSGMCELVKNLLCILPDEIADVAGSFKGDHKYSYAEYTKFIELCARAKQRVMIRDPFERHDGLVLEYGHTIGHALELSAHGQLLHGECVGFGMICAAKISNQLGYMKTEHVDKHYELLRAIGWGLGHFNVNLADFKYFIEHDNKRGYIKNESGTVPMILLHEPGRVVNRDGHCFTAVDLNQIMDVVVETLPQ